MTIRIAATLALALALALASTLGAWSPAVAQDVEPPAPARKKVLVELFTSQGCNSCPPANEFLGQLAKLGYGPDRIVPVAFHVDYFNDPWVDPFSKKDYSLRESAYNSVKKRNDLYFTPMMMVDGRTPMLGSNRTEAVAAIRKSAALAPGASLRMALDGSRPGRTLKVDVAPLSASAADRQVMVGVAVTEGPVSTRVPSGENGGKTLVEHFAVRHFAYKTATLKPSGRQSFAFPISLEPGWVAANVRVAAFVQDWDDGTVHQADSIPWEPAGPPR